MCGIAGIVGPLCKRETLERMGSILRHRGPDDFRIWMGEEEKVGFAHTRLAIIDPKGSVQPMLTYGKRFVLCYNGEIYNYLELQNELYSTIDNMYERWKSASDVEVLLYIFQQMRIEGLMKLNGMFAFAIWDEKEDKMYAARDRFGIKPLYYYFDGENLILASEIKAILKAGIEARIDYEGFSQYVELQYCLGERTMFKDIKRLLPGHYLEYDYYRRSLRCVKYWDIPIGKEDDYDEDIATEEILFLLKDAVRMQLRSDFPFGFHLSGGLDSSTICCIASRLVNGPIKTFTGGFRLEGYDESQHASHLADCIGAVNYSVFPTAEDLRDSFKQIIYLLDEPVAGAAIFPQFFLSKLIAENKVKVVLSGQGGDEVFCGYIRYLIAVVEDCLGREIYGPNATKGSSSGLSVSEILPNLRYLQGYEPLMSRFFSHDLFGDFSQRYYYMMLRTAGLELILSPDIYRQNDEVMSMFVEEFERCPSKNIIDRMAVFDMKNHLQSLLHLEDRASMAWSVESRVPLLDHRIVEAGMKIPGNRRFAGGNQKHIFKRVIRNIVPSAILERVDKKGFPVPISEWFKSELKDWVREILLSKAAKERGIYNIPALESRLNTQGAYDRTVWGLLSIEFWFQNFFDSQG